MSSGKARGFVSRGCKAQGSVWRRRDLIVGQIQVSIDVMPTTIEYARAGKLCALAVTTTTRSPALPDIPTVGDFVPGYEASSWHGVGVPKNTPADQSSRSGGTPATPIDPRDESGAPFVVLVLAA